MISRAPADYRRSYFDFADPHFSESTLRLIVVIA